MYILQELKQEIQQNDRHSVLEPLNESEMNDFVGFGALEEDSSEELLDVLHMVRDDSHFINFS